MQRLQAPKRSLSSLSHSINRHLTAATYTDSPIHTNIYNNNGCTKDFPQCCSKWFLPYTHHTWKMIHGLSYSITSPFARCPWFTFLVVHSRRQLTTTKKPQKSTLKTGHESYTREGLAESKEYQIFFLSQSIHLLLRSLVEQLLRILSPWWQEISVSHQSHKNVGHQWHTKKGPSRIKKQGTNWWEGQSKRK